MASSSIFVFADNTTSGYRYYEAGSTLNPYTVATNKNSADMLGYVLQVLSLNQSRIYDRLSSMSGGSSIDYTSLLTSINNNISTGLYTPINTGTEKLFYVGDTLSYINRPVWTNGEGLGKILTAYMSAMSYNLVSTYNSIQDVVSNTSVLSGIKTDTSNLSAILTGVTDFKTANHTDITSVKTSVDNFKTANHTDITSVNTSVDNFMTANHNDIVNFQTYYNTINWVSSSNTIGVKSELDGEYLTSPYTGKNIFICFRPITGTNIYKLRVPVVIYNGGNGTDIDIDFYSYTGSGSTFSLNDFIITYDFTSSYLDLIFTMPEQFYYGSRDFVIGMSVPNNAPNFRFTSGTDKGYWYMNADAIDYYTVFDKLICRNILDLFRQAKEMYFDDETLASKRANASQTTAVLSNYTGNGSASASAADFGNIKDSVGSVKSGLNTNVSVSNIFNIFNNNDGYGFWSDDTRNELNSTRSNRNNLKTSGVSYTPLYDAKISELYNAMGVNHE